MTEITITIADPQLEFLDNKARELGISKEELIKWYIVSDMLKVIDVELGRYRLSLKGRFKDGPPITEEAIDEAIKQWNKVG